MEHGNFRILIQIVKTSPALIHWLVVLGFNAALTAKVISWRSTVSLTYSPLSHRGRVCKFKLHQCILYLDTWSCHGQSTGTIIVAVNTAK